MSSDLPNDETKTNQRSDAAAPPVVVVAAVGLLLYVLYWLNTQGRFSPIQVGFPNGLLVGYVWMFGTVLLYCLGLPGWSGLLLVSSAAAYPVLLGAGASLVVFSYVALVCGLARSRLTLRTQIILALLLWASIPLARWLVWPINWRTAPLAIFWASLPYSAVYLLVERHRRALSDLPVVADALYLLALPRLVEPFFQPISCRYLYATHSDHFTWRRLRRALGLGLYGAALACAIPILPKIAATTMLGRFAGSMLQVYCKASHQIFISVAFFRFLGYDISSGYRWPIRSRSFAEFFRRWNHYVRDAVLYLFLFPLLGRLRWRLSRRLALILAAYGAIFLGSFVMNDLLVPVATAANPLHGAKEHLGNTLRLALLFVYWSAIILPRAGRRLVTPPPPAGRARRAFENGRFLLMWIGAYAAVWFLGYKLRGL